MTPRKIPPWAQRFGMVQRVPREMIEMAVVGAAARAMEKCKAELDRVTAGYDHRSDLSIERVYVRWDPEERWFDDQGQEQRGMFIACAPTDPWDTLELRAECTAWNNQEPTS